MILGEWRHNLIVAFPTEGVAPKDARVPTPG